MKSIHLVILFSIIQVVGISAQDAVVASGGNSQSPAGSVSYSVGQVSYQTSVGSTGSVSPGVQQPFEITVVTTFDESKNIVLSVSAFPNPTTNYLQLNVESELVKNGSFQLFDANGKMVQTEKLLNTETQIDMSNNVPSSYFLKVLQGDKEVKTFKILKK